MSKRAYILTSECHIIPRPEADNTSSIAYFPLSSIVFEINNAAADILRRMKENPFSPRNKDERMFCEHLVKAGLVNGKTDVLPDPARYTTPRPTRTMLLLSFRCNLKCLYCYGNSETTGEMMTPEIARAAVDEIIRNAKTYGSSLIDVGFHGGGEPTMNWEVLTDVIEYGKERSQHSGLRFLTSICTNGIMPEEHVRYLASNINNITISIDGPPEIQNLQRPRYDGGQSFDRVAATIDILDDMKKPYVFRLTATEHSEGTLADVFTFLAQRFHPRTICIEPLFVCGRCITSNCNPPKKETFINDLSKIMERASRLNTGIQYSGGRLYYLDTRFCGAAGANFFITPTGDVTSCVEVSRREDPRSDIFMYGEYSPETKSFHFDIPKFRRLTEFRVQEFSSCSDCFARWHCSGDCLAKSPDFSHIQSVRNEYRCTINKSITRLQLIRELKKPYINAPPGRRT